MCMLKSGILLKDRVYLSDTDSHDKLLKELGIQDNMLHAQKTFVRVELSPTDGDVFTDTKSWKYRVDQDILPDWYDAADGEERTREAVEKWYAEHVHIGGEIAEIHEGTHYIKDAKVGRIYGTAKINRVHGAATIGNVCGSAEISLVSGSATIGDVRRSAKINHVCSSAKINRVHGSATINCVSGSATINDVSCAATIRNVYAPAKINDVRENAVVISEESRTIRVSKTSGYRLCF